MEVSKNVLERRKKILGLFTDIDQQHLDHAEEKRQRKNKKRLENAVKSSNR